jgi:hypothetical protein
MFISRFLLSSSRPRGHTKLEKKTIEKQKHLAAANDLTGLGAHYGNSLGQIHHQGAGSNPAGQ